MTAKASYPDPFAGAAGACTLYVSATEGPCTEAMDRVREDISEGETGLPMRLALRFVDAACKPVANAKVKIWHTELSGSYTGDTPNDAMCVTVPAAGEKHAFRGVQTTDANGVVYFDSCFPGWYGGRAIHIHFTIATTDKSFTSQLIFDDALVDEIFTTHPEYVPKGLPDTHNANDGVVPANSVSAYTMTVARMSDGAMLASKQISANV